MSSESKSNNNKKILIAVAALVLLAAVLFAVYRLAAPKSAEGAKKITVQVVHGDGSAKDFPVETGEEYLGKVLVAEGIVEDNQSTYGLYILTADGETVDESNQEWWKVTKGGEQVNTGADTTPIADGDTFELTFTVGYDG